MGLFMNFQKYDLLMPIERQTLARKIHDTTTGGLLIASNSIDQIRRQKGELHVGSHIGRCQPDCPTADYRRHVVGEHHNQPSCVSQARTGSADRRRDNKDVHHAENHQSTKGRERERGRVGCRHRGGYSLQNRLLIRLITAIAEINYLFLHRTLCKQHCLIKSRYVFWRPLKYLAAFH